MKRFIHPLLLILARATEKELVQMVEQENCKVALFREMPLFSGNQRHSERSEESRWRNYLRSVAEILRYAQNDRDSDFAVLLNGRVPQDRESDSSQ